MIESPLSELLDEFAPDDVGEIIEEEALPIIEPKRHKRKRVHHADQGFICPCPDCLRKNPQRAKAIAEKKAGK